MHTYKVNKAKGQNEVTAESRTTLEIERFIQRICGKAPID